MPEAWGGVGVKSVQQWSSGREGGDFPGSGGLVGGGFQGALSSSPAVYTPCAEADLSENCVCARRNTMPSSFPCPRSHFPLVYGGTSPRVPQEAGLRTSGQGSTGSNALESWGEILTGKNPIVILFRSQLTAETHGVSPPLHSSAHFRIRIEK